jgi:hypothetical protein
MEQLCIHLSVLNLNHFKMVQAMGLKLLHRGPLQWHRLPTKFNEKLPSGSNAITGDRQTGDLISCHSSFMKKSRLKRNLVGLNCATI